MKININKNGISLDNVSIGDLLIFPDRQEIVVKIDPWCVVPRNLYTKRKTRIEHMKMIENVLYKIGSSDKIEKDSRREVYGWGE